MNSSKNKTDSISIGARDSTLSKVQVTEVVEAIKKHYPSLSFSRKFFKTSGDFHPGTAPIIPTQAQQ